MNRFKSVGLGMLAVLLVVLGIPLWLNWRSHPLAGESQVDVCAIVRAEALQRLPETPESLAPDLPSADRRSPGDPACHVRLPAELDAAERLRLVSTVLFTERNMKLQGGGQRSARMYETWVAEARASGAEVREIAGPWLHGVSLSRRVPGALAEEVLVADDGILLWFRSSAVTQERLIAFAESTARRARD